VLARHSALRRLDETKMNPSIVGCAILAKHGVWNMTA
jgi:hypothetical protein